jgi:hypothetical protein
MISSLIVHTFASFRIPHSELRTEQQRFYILKQCVALSLPALGDAGGFCPVSPLPLESAGGRGGTGIRANPRSGAVFFLDRLVHFLAMYWHMLRRFNAQADFIAANIYDRDHNVVANHDALVTVSR